MPFHLLFRRKLAHFPAIDFSQDRHRVIRSRLEIQVAARHLFLKGDFIGVRACDNHEVRVRTRSACRLDFSDSLASRQNRANAAAGAARRRGLILQVNRCDSDALEFPHRARHAVDVSPSRFSVANHRYFHDSRNTSRMRHHLGHRGQAKVGGANEGGRNAEPGNMQGFESGRLRDERGKRVETSRSDDASFFAEHLSQFDRCFHLFLLSTWHSTLPEPRGYRSGGRARPTDESDTSIRNCKVLSTVYSRSAKKI